DAIVLGQDGHVAVALEALRHRRAELRVAERGLDGGVLGQVIGVGDAHEEGAFEEVGNVVATLRGDLVAPLLYELALVGAPPALLLDQSLLQLLVDALIGRVCRHGREEERKHQQSHLRSTMISRGPGMNTEMPSVPTMLLVTRWTATAS